MYWAQDRGKTKMVQTMHSTFDALYTDMNIPSNGMTGGTSSQNAYSGLCKYIERKGYSIPYWGTAQNSTYSWSWAMARN